MQPEFITSDHHFGHGNVIRYSNRPFASADEMDEALIRAWNARVPHNGIVYHLGDFSFHKNRERTKGIRHRLNGTIRLLKGNHDRLKGDMLDLFEWVKDYYEAKSPSGVKVVMCHYPFMTWNKSHHNSWSLHGHCHNSLRPPAPLDDQKRMDVGVDTHPDYAPYTWDEIEKFMSKKGRAVIDHHGRGD
jgi:calcineurin-like phosphoesterase family protein